MCEGFLESHLKEAGVCAWLNNVYSNVVGWHKNIYIYYTSANVGPEAYLLIHFLNYPGKKGYFDCTRCPKVEEFRKARSQISSGSFHFLIVLQIKKKNPLSKKG